VVTGREWRPARESVEFYSGDLETLVHMKLAPRFRNIWLAGGAMLCQRFLELGLVDEIRLTWPLSYWVTDSGYSVASSQRRGGI
jgi:riboflavin biosynthesis pyrimidine reductase